MTGSRRGSTARRRLEFRAIVRAVRKDKAGFIARLERNLAPAPGGHQLWTGSCDRTTGYCSMNLRLDGKHVRVGVQRVFLILKLGRAIRAHHEAGHDEGCTFRHCVAHVSEQTWRANLGQRDRKQAARAPGPDVPF